MPHSFYKSGDIVTIVLATSSTAQVLTPEQNIRFRDCNIIATKGKLYYGNGGVVALATQDGVNPSCTTLDVNQVLTFYNINANSLFFKDFSASTTGNYAICTGVIE